MDPANIPLYYTALGVTRCPGARTPKPKQVTKKEKEVLPLGITVDFDTQKAEYFLIFGLFLADFCA